MYRAYENLYFLESRLADLCAMRDSCTDDTERMDLDISIAELKERINFAWQDDEFDCDCSY